MKAKWLLLLPALGWLALFLLAPLLLVAAASCATRGPGGGVEWRWSMEAWRAAWDPALLRVFWRTLEFSFFTTLLCLAAGLPLAWFIVQRGPRVRRIAFTAVLLPLVANSLVLVYAWMNLLARDGLAGRALIACGLLPDGEQLLYTGTASLLGMVYYYLPFMVYPVYVSLEKLDWRLVEAAADLGAGARQTLRHVVLPLVWPGIASGCLLVFIQSVGTFVIPDLLGGSKSLLLGTVIHGKFLGMSPHWPLGAAVALMTVAVITAGLVLYFKVQTRIRRGEQP